MNYVLGGHTKWNIYNQGTMRLRKVQSRKYYFLFLWVEFYFDTCCGDSRNGGEAHAHLNKMRVREREK